ncbi:MAG: hypothetical protein AB7W28_05145 [Armatimonadota bacterium]
MGKLFRQELHLREGEIAVEGVYCCGKVEHLEVTPKSRAVQGGTWQCFVHDD